MQQLAHYLLKHMVLDFDGDVNMDHINKILIEDGSSTAHDLRSRFVADGGPDDFLLLLADVLKDQSRNGIREEHVVEQVGFYLQA